MTTSAAISKPRGIDAVYYLVQDMARGRRFYEEFLGFVPTHVAGGEGGWEGAEYEMPTGQTFGIGKSAQAPWRPSGGMMLSVHDVGEAAKRVAEGGGKVVMGPVDTAVCFMAWCEDTEGNTFSLHHRKDGSVG
jgi:predicted enzyme related to lactoylglutathione lyase